MFTAVAAVLALSTGGAAAATHNAPASKSGTTYASQPATVSRANGFTQLPQGIRPNPETVACSGSSDAVPIGACSLTPPGDDGGDLGSPTFVPKTPATPMGNGSGSLGSNFNGISDVDQRSVTGFHFTPPDQALCVGPAGPLEGGGVPLGVPKGQTVVVEMVNDGWGVFTQDGTRLFLQSDADLFGDPNSSGDIECNFDQSSNSYYMTEIGALNGEFFDTSLVVMNAGGYSAYDLNTSESGFCFPDFPHQGYDNNALYITINEFCGPKEEFAGSSIFALSKQQVVNHQVPDGVSWSLGNTFFSFRAATGDPTNTEYLLASEQNDVTQNALDFAQVTGDNKIGKAPVFLTVTSLPSESYTEPVDAQSTGDGTTCEQTLSSPPGFSPATYCSIPEKTLDPVDMRLEQLQYSNGQLYSSLSTSLTVGQDPTVVDGAAWFQVDPKAAKVVNQGYVGVAGTYLLMPSLVATASGHGHGPGPGHGPDKAGTLLLGFSMTSPTLNPSSGYMVSTDGGKTFGAVTTTGVGSGPHISFSDNDPAALRKRWGDYSRIALDPATGNAWVADEYIPSVANGGGDTVDNWGTRVWEVTH